MTAPQLTKNSKLHNTAGTKQHKTYQQFSNTLGPKLQHVH